MAAGRYTSPAINRVGLDSSLSRRASFAAVVVLPEPWSPTIITIVGGTELSCSPARCSPTMLCRRDGAQRRHADRLLLDALEELARELEVYVGFEKDPADFAETLLDIGIGEHAAAAKARERCFQFL